MAVVNIMPETLAQFTGVTPEQAQAWATENGVWIKDIIDGHKAWLAAEGVEKFQSAYDGFLEEIDQRDKSRGDDVNNKLMPNYAAVVVDTPVDYLLGKPIVWAFGTDDKEEAKRLEAVITEYRTEMLKLIRTEDAQRILAEQLRQGGIAGYSAVIAWVDETGKIDYDEFPVQEVVPVYDVRGRLQLVLRYYPYEITKQTEKGIQKVEVTRVEVYDEKYVTFYVSDELGESFELDEEAPAEHKAGRIPVSIFVNGTPARYEKRQKKNGTSDLGNGVLTLLVNFAHVMSDKANTVDRLLDQYLVLSGVDTDKNEVQKMRQTRAIVLKSEQSKAEFLAQEQEDQAIENHLNRLRDTIHDTTGVPKLNDLSGATATEIKVKYAGLDIKAGKKELYFTAALKQLISVLTDMLNAKRLVESKVSEEDIHGILRGDLQPPKKVALYNPEWVSFTINRNLPQNFLEIAQIFGTLAGKVPDEYLYELLWFIDDPEAALEAMKKQREEEAKLARKTGLAAMGYDDDFQDTGKDKPVDDEDEDNK